MLRQEDRLDEMHFSEAGCDRATLRLIQGCGDDVDALIAVLEGRREDVLRAVHLKEDQLCRLDYLIHRLRKEREE